MIIVSLFLIELFFTTFPFIEYDNFNNLRRIRFEWNLNDVPNDLTRLNFYLNVHQ